MAYLPYRMYGNGNVNLPIIDIVQTINSTAHACRVKRSSRIGINTSGKELYYTKKDSEYVTTRKDKQSPKFWKKKSVSYDFLPKETLENHELKNHKKSINSKGKPLRSRQNASQVPMETIPSRVDNDVKEEKSLQVLFKAERSNTVFDRDGMDDDESTLSVLRNSFTSSSDLKRKASFADYIKMKRKW